LETLTINLALRFGLELAALFSFGIWGWQQGYGSSKYLLAFGLPLIAMLLWGLFNVPGDPSRSGSAPVPVAGLVRLLLEFAIFLLAWIAMRDAVSGRWYVLFGVLIAVHYALSLDRIQWLLDRP